MKRIQWYAVLSCVVIIFSLAGCSRKAAATKATPLTFWTYVDQHSEFFNEAVARWNAQNPNECGVASRMGIAQAPGKPS
jgi:ABC-type glycerol-3-phosphate transport system substrate-binding protein